MLDLEEALGALRPDRSLLLCYSASLTHLEYSLLHRLQSQGAGRVTLVVDPRSYAQSFAESTAVSGAGIDYSFASLHLPSPQAAFHPKLYLLCHEDGATLFVASANLTLTGCRRNAEIVDQFHLRADGTGDVQAFRQYTRFLELIAGFDPSLSQPARDDILGAADVLREMVGEDVAEEGSEFLHTLEEPLLDQVVARLPTDDIDEIVAVSPFFDFQSEALLRLASSFPSAQIRLYRRPESPNDINGRALASLRDRLSIYDFELLGEGNADRPLHAKWFLFRNGDHAWLVAGSANLSAPAWLRTAQSGGNVEAVTFRAVENPQLWRDLTSSLGENRIEDWAGLMPTRDSESATIVSPGFRVREVRLETERVYVELLFDEGAWSTATFTLQAAGTFRPQPLIPANARVGEAEGALFWCAAPEGLLRDETPIVVEVEGLTDAGEHASSRAWLSRPSALERDADERSFRRSLRNMERRGLWTDGGDLIRVSDLLARLASRVAEIQAEEPSRSLDLPVEAGSGASERGKQKETKERWIAGVTAGEGGSVVGGHSTSEPGALLERIVAGLRAAWKGRLDDLEDAQSRQELRQPSGETAEYEAGEEDVPEERSPLRTSDISILVRRLWEMAEEIQPDRPDPADMFGRARMASALADFAFFLYLRLETSEQSERSEVAQFLWEWFDQIFSMEGFALARARGWMVHAWMNPATRDQVDRVWTSRSTAIPMTALLGATLSLQTESHSSREAASRSLVAGFQLVSGWTSTRQDIERLESLREYARAIATFPGAPDAEVIVDRVMAPVVDASPVFRLARECASLLQHQLGTVPYEVGGRDVEPPGAVRRRYERLAGRRESPMLPLAVMGEENFGCGKCHISLPFAETTRAVHGAETLECPQCGRILLPFDFNNPSVRAVLEEALASGAEES
jgi:hypothetical protein